MQAASAPPSALWSSLERRAELIAGLLACGWVVCMWDAPLVEDSLFWWVPKGLLAAEIGPRTVLAHTLPAALTDGLTPQTMPPQWAGGLPDYAHPPLWYWWLGMWLWVSPTIAAVHLACAPVAAAAAAGLVALARRLGSPLAGLAVLAMPPVFSQLLRPELDLPLLAASVWALVALVDGRWTRFAILAALATWCKEPGVLLIVPAAWRAIRERRLRWQLAAPALALLAWGALHGGLATPERLPESPSQWLLVNLPLALRLCFFEQGRWLLLAGLPWMFRRPLPGQIVAVFALTWVVFFSVVGFFASGGGLQPLTHVRYFGPGLVVAAMLLSARWPLLPLVGLLWARAANPFGPEASLFGVDAARAESLAAPWVSAQVAAGESVWVGSYQAAGLTQPWAGLVAEPVSGFRVYGLDTAPGDVPAQAILMIAAYGEPAGRLQRGLVLEELEQWSSGEATVTAWRVSAVR